MSSIARALLEAVFVLVACFVVLVMFVLDEGGGPTALRLAGVVAAVCFVARSLYRPAPRVRATARRAAPASAGRMGAGLGVGVAAAAALAAQADDDGGSTIHGDPWPALAGDGAHKPGGFDINPANGLPMMGAVDVMGNPYGTDSSTAFDSFGSRHDGFGDGFGGNGSSSF